MNRGWFHGKSLALPPPPPPPSSFPLPPEEGLALSFHRPMFEPDAHLTKVVLQKQLHVTNFDDKGSVISGRKSLPVYPQPDKLTDALEDCNRSSDSAVGSSRFSEEILCHKDDLASARIPSDRSPSLPQPRQTPGSKGGVGRERTSEVSSGDEDGYSIFSDWDHYHLMGDRNRLHITGSAKTAGRHYRSHLGVSENRAGHGKTRGMEGPRTRETKSRFGKDVENFSEDTCRRSESGRFSRSPDCNRSRKGHRRFQEEKEDRSRRRDQQRGGSTRRVGKAKEKERNHHHSQEMNKGEKGSKMVSEIELLRIVGMVSCGQFEPAMDMTLSQVLPEIISSQPTQPNFTRGELSQEGREIILQLKRLAPLANDSQILASIPFLRHFFFGFKPPDSNGDRRSSSVPAFQSRGEDSPRTRPRHSNDSSEKRKSQTKKRRREPTPDLKNFPREKREFRRVSPSRKSRQRSELQRSSSRGHARPIRRTVFERRRQVWQRRRYEGGRLFRVSAQHALVRRQPQEHRRNPLQSGTTSHLRMLLRKYAARTSLSNTVKSVTHQRIGTTTVEDEDSSRNTSDVSVRKGFLPAGKDRREKTSENQARSKNPPVVKEQAEEETREKSRDSNVKENSETKFEAREASNGEFLENMSPVEIEKTTAVKDDVGNSKEKVACRSTASPIDVTNKKETSPSDVTSWNETSPSEKKKSSETSKSSELPKAKFLLPDPKPPSLFSLNFTGDFRPSSVVKKSSPPLLPTPLLPAFPSPHVANPFLPYSPSLVTGGALPSLQPSLNWQRSTATYKGFQS